MATKLPNEVIVSVHLDKATQRLWRMAAASEECSTPMLIRRAMTEMLAKIAERDASGR